MQTTTSRFRAFWPGADGDASVSPTMWRLWLGFNWALRPLTIAVPAAYFALALRFWFYVPAIVMGGALTSFTLSALAA